MSWKVRDSLINHIKLTNVNSICNDVAVLRRGKLDGGTDSMVVDLAVTAAEDFTAFFDAEFLSSGGGTFS